MLQTTSPVALRLDLKAVRILLRRSIDDVARETKTSAPTVRMFEANEEAVSPEKRAVLGPYYKGMIADVEAKYGAQ